MDRITSLIIKEYCDNNEDCKYFEGYVGRGMFSCKCIGIDCKGNVLQQLVRLCDFLYENGISNVEEILGTVCVDSLGMGSFLYFPELMLDC